MSKFDFDTPVDRRNSNCEKWDCATEELPMWIADMDFKTAPCIQQALEKRLEHGIFGYSKIPFSFKKACQRWWKERHNFLIDTDWIIYTSGVVPALSTAVRKFSTPAEKIVVMSPCYNIFFNSIVNNGRRILESPLEYDSEKNSYSINWKDLEEKLSDPLSAMLIVCNPHNPTGNIWTKEELSKIGDLCKKYGITVFSDEAHCDLTEPKTDYTPFSSAGENCKACSITAVSPSKTFNIAGLHSAAVIIPDKNIFRKMNRALNTDEVAEPNSFAIEAAVAAWEYGDEWLDELRAYLKKNRDFAEEEIKRECPSLKVVHSKATYLIWIDISASGLSSTDAQNELRKKTGLILSCGKQYGGNGDSFLRLNAACPFSVLKDGIKRLTDFFKNL